MCQMVWELINCKGFYEATDFDAFFKAHLIYFRFQANLFNINKLTAKKKKTMSKSYETDYSTLIQLNHALTKNGQDRWIIRAGPILPYLL